MNIKQEIEKIGLSEEQYEQCLNDICDKLNGLKDIEWAEIKDKYNLPWATEVIRKSSGTLLGGFGVAEYYKTKQNPSYIEQMESIRRERQKLSDERTALRKASRENARGEVNFEILKELISKNGKETFEYFPTVVEDNGNDLIVCLSDLHIGLNAKSEFGNYNHEIAKDRLVQYLKEILLIQNTHKSQNVYIVCLGDLISGNIHPTIQLENRENVVQQVQMAAEYISAFLYELSGHFKNVYISDVPGNHSRIGLKENVLRDERLDDLIIWYAKAKLEHLDNVIFLDDKYDITLSSIKVRNREYIICHGDFDSFSESGLNKLCMFIGHIPTGIFMGHLHHCSFDDINNVKLIRSGSFMGTCDDYTISKRLYSKPSQMVCVADNKGIRAFYPIFLN